MKRVLAVALAVVVMVAVFAGCTPKEEEFTCGFCGEKVTSVPYPVTYDGQDMTICQGCYDGLKANGLVE